MSKNLYLRGIKNVGLLSALSRIPDETEAGEKRKRFLSILPGLMVVDTRIVALGILLPEIKQSGLIPRFAVVEATHSHACASARHSVDWIRLS